MMNKIADASEDGDKKAETENWFFTIVEIIMCQAMIDSIGRSDEGVKNKIESRDIIDFS